MDITLKDYMYLAQKLHDEIQLKGVGMKSKELEDSIKKIKTYIKNIQAVAKYMADICNSITQSSFMVKKINSVDFETYPSPTDHVCMRFSNRDFVKEVDSVDKIPISNLYYVRPLKQYAINIGGIVIKGNLAEISNGQIAQKTFPCRKGQQCLELKNNMCPFYHVPEDYLNNKLEVKNDRVLSNVSWIYDPTSHKNTRKIGGKSTIDADLLRIKSLDAEISTREFQLIHDLLVLMRINEAGLNKRFHFWDVSYGLKNEK